MIDENEQSRPDTFSSQLSEDELKMQKKRNRAIALALVGFMALIFTITVLRLASNISAGAAG